ncbi:MAG: hypothetical protein WBI40_04290 [Methylococcaceae bacterium]
MKEKQFYVYLHLRPTNDGFNSVFYVGKGLKARVNFVHRKTNPYHTRIVSKYGKENITIKKIACESEQHAFDLEIQMIAKLREMGVKLTNLTDGGEGFSGYFITPEAREKMSVAQKLRFSNPEEIVKNSDRLKLYFKNKEARQKNAAALRLHYEDNPKTKDKISASLKLFYKENPDALKKMSEGKKIYYQDNPSVKAKISNSLTLYFKDEKNRAKISDSVKKLWKNKEYRLMMINAQKLKCENKAYKEKLSKSVKELWSNPDYRAKQIESRLAAKGTPEARARNSAALKLYFQNNPESDETKAKKSASAKAAWAKRKAAKERQQLSLV